MKIKVLSDPNVMKHGGKNCANGPANVNTKPTIILPLKQEDVSEFVCVFVSLLTPPKRPHQSS